METISLAGLWLLSLGAPAPVFPPADMSAPPPASAYSERIELPGTTETRGVGPLNDAVETQHLTRVRKFDDAAWYRRDIDIPAAWSGKRVELHLERTKYTQVWLDGKPVGQRGLYTVPQSYDLTTAISPGAHQLTVMVDNRAERRPVQADTHQFSDNTQTNWNGLLGRIELRATPRVWLDDVSVTPDVAAKRFVIRATLGNITGRPAGGKIRVRARSWNHAGAAQVCPEVTVAFAEADSGKVVEVAYPLGKDARLWDEFSPALYEITATIESEAGRDERVVHAGLRDFRTRGTQFTINGRTTFLRGKHDACVFPLTGHPPMDVEGWMTYLAVFKEYGLNHLRCHTWVPPEAAFEAADRLGIYLQPELPFWGTFDAKVRDWLMPEAEALLREYGNHPSFVMLTLGNEVGGDRALMNAMVEHLRALDPRRLYADGSNNVLWDPQPQPTNDFFTTAKVKTPATGGKSVPVRGSFCVLDGEEGHTQWGPAETRFDLRAALVGISMPVVGHETGQWTTYPDFRDIGKYTGVTRARNLERFKTSLARHGMSEQANDFFRASGKLAALLYREENELFLRTPGIGGFQLLDLQDFPGQGTALVGMLNAFMESKGAITAEDWRRSCDAVVPLARFDKYTWTTGETYSADVEIAHYGRADWRAARASWALKDAAGKTVRQGEWKTADIAQGGLRAIGKVDTSLADLPAPARYELEVTVKSGTGRAVNNWPLWVYPENVRPVAAETVTVVRAYDAEARRLLAAGKRVVLIPDDRAWADTVSGAFATDYWCWPMFDNTPGTMGILCDPGHPALAHFPTNFYSERQWSAIVHAATPVILTDAPRALRPIVQVIDNLERNDKLGLVFEAKVGTGSLLVCAVDLYALEARPEARQLFDSLLRYAASKDFSPAVKINADELAAFLRASLATGAPVTASSVFQPPWGAVPEAARAVDGDINTRWIAKQDDKTPSLSVDLGGAQKIDTIELLWENDEAGYRYLLEGSNDGIAWTTLSDQRENAFTGGRHWVKLDAAEARHVRVTLTAFPGGGRACLRELRVLGE